ncbi:MAG: haloacid dehalogenase-like hydrolase [Paludibacteraceae bacterium]|nr:haloacid dehalogenase-like hydrolase [Paludibacteraceae bacterium]
MKSASVTYTFVDICWTLFYSNTTFDFLDFCVQDEAYLRLRRRFKRPFFRYMNLLLYKAFRYDTLRIKAVAFLRGKTRSELQQLAEAFYKSRLEPNKIEPVWQLLPDKDIVIASGTLDVIADTVARRLPVREVYASCLEYDKNDVCTGRFRDFLLDKDRLAGNYGNYTIFTDNLTDAALVRNARHAYIVTYGNRRRWERQLPQETPTTYIHADRQRY